MSVQGRKVPSKGRRVDPARAAAGPAGSGRTVTVTAPSSGECRERFLAMFLRESKR